MLLTVALAINLQVTPAHAILLGDLVDDANSEIVQGDKRFANFELSNITINSPLNLIPDDPRDIDIQGFTNLLGEHGLRLVGPFQASTTPANSQAVLGFFLEYDVSVTDPQFLIHDLPCLFLLEYRFRQYKPHNPSGLSS